MKLYIISNRLPVKAVLEQDTLCFPHVVKEV